MAVLQGGPADVGDKISGVGTSRCTFPGRARLQHGGTATTRLSLSAVGPFLAAGWAFFHPLARAYALLSESCLPNI